jgi:hypothetical protein
MLLIQTIHTVMLYGHVFVNAKIASYRQFVCLLCEFKLQASSNVHFFVMHSCG